MLTVDKFHKAVSMGFREQEMLLAIRELEAFAVRDKDGFLGAATLEVVGLEWINEHVFGESEDGGSATLCQTD